MVRRNPMNMWIRNCVKVEERFLAESLTDLSRLPPPPAGSTAAAATTLQGPDGEQMAID